MFLSAVSAGFWLVIDPRGIMECLRQEVGRGTLKMRDWKMWHQTAMVENAGLENAGPICRVENARNNIVWNTVYSL